METRLNRPDRLTKHSMTETILRDECMETRLNRPDRLTKHSTTETILMLQTSVWKPGLIVQTV